MQLETEVAVSATEARRPFTNWFDVITPEERRELLRVSPWRSWVTVLTNLAVVFAAMSLVARWPNPLTIVLALFLIGARQLGMAVVMHEAAHRSLFPNRRLNDWVGNWLGAYPIWTATEAYRPYHLRHHAKNWTEEDPDRGLATPFPITRASFRRKVLRDLTGRTGVKFARASWKRSVGLFQPEAQGRRETSRAFRGMLITNGVLLGIVTVAGHPLLYLLWPAAWLTTYTLVTRFRSIAEHSMALDPADDLLNTRTTRARWWERLFLAPNRVNYHLEHHLLMTVPHYNLPKLHRLLRERGILDHALIANGYFTVLRQAASKAA